MIILISVTSESSAV